MDPNVTVLLATATGALVGTIVGVLVMRRQLRPLVTETELAELKGSLQRSESSLAAATSNAEDLEKQVSQRDKTIKQASEDLRQKQQQLDLVLLEAQAETTRRSEAEHKIQELVTQTGALTEQRSKIEAKLSEQEKQFADSLTRIASLQGDIDAGKRHAEELKEQIARVTLEAAELRTTSEQEGRYRSSLEMQLRTEREQIGHLSGRVTELQSERAQLEVRLQEERGSAARGMELLMMAQEKLAGLFKPVASDAQNGAAGNGSAASAIADAVTPAKMPEAKPEAVIASRPDALSA